jgi:hypothetical protein
MADLRTDERNANKGTVRGLGMVERSLQQYGAGRSILVDRHGVAIAGNKTLETAERLGIPVHVIESDGRTLYAIQRTDLDLATDNAAKELGIADNRSSELGLDWDVDVLASFQEDGIDLEQFWFPEELDRILSGLPDGDAWGDAFGSLPDGDKSPFQQMTFTVSDDQAEQINAAISAAKGMGAFVDTGNENSNGNALARICETFLTVVAR